LRHGCACSGSEERTVTGQFTELRDAFTAAGYTVDGVADRIGPRAQAALLRGETVPAGLATASGDALDGLIRLFLLQRHVPVEQAAKSMPLETALALGLVAVQGERVRALLDVRPYGETGERDAWWVVSDLGSRPDRGERPGAPLADEHVVGIGGASTTLAQWTVRDQVGSTLDLGTGCGVQALHASRHSARVVATDISGRAVRMAQLTAALSGVELDLRQGDLLEPVHGESFDLVVSNPPFVVGAPPTVARTYRDARLPLDAITERLVRELPARLNAGGTAQLLGSWVHRAGEDWEGRVSGWLPDGVDALVVQREVLDPTEYVATWLRDAGEEGTAAYGERYEAWLAALDAERVDGIAFGMVALRRTDQPTRATLLDWPHPVEQPLGAHVGAWFARQRALASGPVPDLVLAIAPDVVQEQLGRPGAEDPEHLVLRQQVGLRRAESVCTATAAVAGACDGRLPVGALLTAVREVLGADMQVGDEQVLDEVATLVEAGILSPAG
jgi:methylase of polypeptide subunit release factors